ncbi:hypothetical protein F5883DRAFT_430760, partial [Diaporthe sp. PMI_573]
PVPPLPTKRGQGLVGGDLIVSYYSNLGQCKILPSSTCYTNAGNFKAGAFLTFNPSIFVSEFYPHLLSTDGEEKASLLLLLSMFSAGARPATLEEDWEGKWFTMISRICPNKLTFQGVRLDCWQDNSHAVQVALALPRDGALTPITPRLLRTSDASAPWPQFCPTCLI